MQRAMSFVDAAKPRADAHSPSGRASEITEERIDPIPRTQYHEWPPAGPIAVRTTGNSRYGNG
jgi:hypothetical protein